MRKVKVSLGCRSYSISIGAGLLTRLGRECQKLGLGRRCVVFSDRHVAPLYGPVVERSLSAAGFRPAVITLPAGETTKNLQTVAQCYEQLAAHRIERASFVVALGGGVIGDLAGFVAATYLRGIGLVQVPTTLLALVDSSVGGKTGVNLQAGKNLVGAFYQPRLVLGDLDTLSTLPDRELRAGLAEVIKYGVIYDAALFRRLERDLAKLLQRDPAALASVIARCCEIKADVVGQDETEGGLRAILNYGHTIGHAIEATAGYGTYLHGEAIAIGQVAAAQLSAHLLGLPANDVARIAHLLQKAGLPTAIPLGPDWPGPRKTAALNRLLAAMKIDKKVSAGEIKFVLARRLGQVAYGQTVSEPLLKQLLLGELGNNDTWRHKSATPGQGTRLTGACRPRALTRRDFCHCVENGEKTLPTTSNHPASRPTGRTSSVRRATRTP